MNHPTQHRGDLLKQGPNDQSATCSQSVEAQLRLEDRGRSSILARRLPSFLLLLFLLLLPTEINRAQTPQPSQLGINAPAGNVWSTARNPTARDKAAQPTLSTGRAPDRAQGAGHIFKRAARGILRFGKGVVSFLRFGEGRNSSAAKSKPTSERQDQVVVLKPVAAVHPPTASPVAVGNAEITVKGRIVAELKTAASLMYLTDIPNLQILIFRTEDGTTPQGPPRYLKVHYEYPLDGKALSKTVLDSRNQWLLLLKRDFTCDGSIEEFETPVGDVELPPNTEAIPFPGLVTTVGAESEVIPRSLPLACYVLRPQGLKAIKTDTSVALGEGGNSGTSSKSIKDSDKQFSGKTDGSWQATKVLTSEHPSGDSSAGVQAAGSIAPTSALDWVRLKFEIDGKEKQQRYKIFFYVNGQEIEPMLVDGGFLVPPEVKNAKWTEVRFKSGAYDLFFGSVYQSKFATDWLVGIDTKPFDSENVSDEAAKRTKIIYYINFESRVGDDTRLVVAVTEAESTPPKVDTSTNEREAAVLDLCELVGNWQKYHRTRVRVRAIMGVGAEQTWLSDPACRNGKALTDVSFHQHPAGDTTRLDQITAKDRQAWVTLEGTFYGPEVHQNVDPKLPARIRETLEKSPRGYGHLGSFESQIEVTKVVEATQVTTNSSAKKR